MEWWIWVLLGFFLLLTELITPGGFFFIFFGIAAVIVGALSGFDVAGPVWFQILLFSVLSVAALWLFRGKLLHLTRSTEPDRIDLLVGETAVITEAIAANAIGKAELRGASWSARNIGDRTLSRGERCRVERIEGLTIFVRAETG